MKVLNGRLLVVLVAAGLRLLAAPFAAIGSSDDPTVCYFPETHHYLYLRDQFSVFRARGVRNTSRRPATTA